MTKKKTQSATIIPFGKYKNQPVEVLASDKDYCDWLTKQDWFRTRYNQINTLIINNFANDNDDTPDHNYLQAKFCDEEWVKSFIYSVDGQRLKIRFEKQKKAYIDGAVKSINLAIENYVTRCNKISLVCIHTLPVREVSFSECDKCMNNAGQMRSEQEKDIAIRIKEYKRANSLILDFEMCVEFEDEGADIEIHIDGNFIKEKYRIECKPSIGDDYPAILRQMKANKCDVLLIGDGGCNAGGANLNQIKQIFLSSNIKIRFLNEIKDWTPRG